jgi:hypothetical protein
MLIGTPRSARMSVSSSSSQSTGLPVNFWMMFLKNPMGMAIVNLTSEICASCAGRASVPSPPPRSRMPLTKRPESSEPNRLAISMASLMQTTGGTSLNRASRRWPRAGCCGPPGRCGAARNSPHTFLMRSSMASWFSRTPWISAWRTRGSCARRIRAASQNASSASARAAGRSC